MANTKNIIGVVLEIGGQLLPLPPAFETVDFGSNLTRRSAEVTG